MAAEPVERIIYFLLPVFNEKENIPALHQTLKSILPGRKKIIVFVDDGSSDGTKDAILSAFKDSDCMVLGDGKNYGPGAAFNTGFDHILSVSSGKNDLVVTLESDNTSDPEILPVMISLAEMKYDLVLASVYAQGGGFDKTSFLRKLISFFANILLRLIFGIKILTLSSFYRVYRIELLSKLKSKHGKIITENGFIAMIEILIRCIRLNAEMIEVPMLLHSKKRVGKSKMKVMKEMIGYFRFFIKRMFND